MRRQSFIILYVVFFGFFQLLAGQESVRIWEEPLVLPTYIVKAPDKNPMFFRNQSYQGASRYIYPYALEDNITNEKVDKTYKALYLENEYIKLCVLPEIGGRLFYATDKTNGYEIFYRQHVIKPANIGMLGAWISGGIEFCVFHHHRASTNIPVDYKLVKNENGSATIWIGETEPRHRMKWSLGISLYPGKSYIEVDGRLFNPTENANSILYWANVATHVNEDYQIIFPPSTDFAVYHAKNSFTHWPITSNVYNGKEYYKKKIDASWWKNHPEPVSMFAHNIEDGFLAGYDHGKKAGTMHVANHHIVKGAKLWEWGPGAYGSMWDSKVLTDSDGPYAELMAGAYSDNQPDYSWIKPYETKTFKQYWYPLRETQGAVAANLNATLNLKKLNDQEFFIAVNTTQVYQNASISLMSNEEVVFQSEIDISPRDPFYKTILLSDVKEADLSLLLKDEEGKELISYQSAEKKSNQPLPDPVTPPQKPEEIESLEELYFTGLRIKQFHNARIDPEPYFLEALKRDPLDSRSNTMMGIIRKEEFKLDEAARYFRMALKRLTANYTRPRNCEPFYHLGVVLQKQGKYEAAYDTLYRAAWDHNFASAAYFHLAQISTAKENYQMALNEINRSLDYNNANLRAKNLKISILRRLGLEEEAIKQMQEVFETDPLNFYALNEGVQLDVKQMPALNEAMRGHPESYLELATKFMNSGLKQEAKSILLIAVHSEVEKLKNYPTLHYYLGYICTLEGNDEEAKKYFDLGRKLSTDYCFPFRFESIEVYNAALKYNPTDSRAYYYLGNLLYDRQPGKAIELWERAVDHEPALSIAHRNLGWGYNHVRNDLNKAIRAYETAIRHDKTDPRYYLELDRLYEKNGTDIEKRYELLRRNHQYVAQRPDALLQEIEVLTLYGETAKAIDYLVNHFFPRQEGVDNLHDLYVDACLAQGLTEFASGNYEAALTYFEMADKYPENHQIARNTNNPRNAQIYYYQALAHEKIKKKNAVPDLFQKIAGMELGDPKYKFYQALALQKLGKQKEAVLLSQSIKEESDKLLSSEDRVDFFSKFGEGQSEKVKQSEGYYLLALSDLISGKEEKALSNLETAKQLNPNHLWVKLHLQGIHN